MINVSNIPLTSRATFILIAAICVLCTPLLAQETGGGDPTIQIIEPDPVAAPVLEDGRETENYGPVQFKATVPVGVNPDDIRWSATGLPLGLTLSNTTGDLTGVPALGAAGSHTFMVTAYLENEGTGNSPHARFVADETAGRKGADPPSLGVIHESADCGTAIDRGLVRSFTRTIAD